MCMFWEYLRVVGFFCSSLRVGTLKYLTLCYICMMFDLEVSPEFFGPKQKCLWCDSGVEGGLACFSVYFTHVVASVKLHSNVTSPSLGSV